jgi:hypothetical protein
MEMQASLKTIGLEDSEKVVFITSGILLHKWAKL